MSAGWSFELTGGALCLDFTNTLGDRPRCHDEHLQGYADLLAFGRQTGSLATPLVRELEERSRRRPRQARAALRAARELREQLFSLFTAAHQGRAPHPEAAAALNRRLRKVAAQRELRPERLSVWSWGFRDEQPMPLDRPLWPIVVDAAQLLASGALVSIGECASDTCSWLFIDKSRGARRRWCDMRSCGNRAKAQRHYARARKVKS